MYVSVQIYLINTAFKLPPMYLVLIVCCFAENRLYIAHMYCDLAFSKGNVKEGFLVDYMSCSSMFFIIVIIVIYIL